MKKLRLDLNRLAVESFTPDEAALAVPGTVKGHDLPTRPRTCADSCNTCSPQATCYNTCNCMTWSGAECNTVCVG